MNNNYKVLEEDFPEIFLYFLDLYKNQKIYNKNSLDDDLLWLFKKIKLHLISINSLFLENKKDPFSIVPLARLVSETYSIIQFIKTPSNKDKKEFNWLVWNIKSYIATKTGKYDFEIIKEGRTIFDEKVMSYINLIQENSFYISEGNPTINSSFLKKYLPGYEDLYKKYLPIGKLYNQYSWVSHPSAIGVHQIQDNDDSFIIYSNAIAFEMNFIMSKLIIEANFHKDKQIVNTYNY